MKPARDEQNYTGDGWVHEPNGINPLLVRQTAHELNNCLTALYCQIDLALTSSGQREMRQQIETLLAKAAGEVRLLAAACREAEHSPPQHHQIPQNLPPSEGPAE